MATEIIIRRTCNTCKKVIPEGAGYVDVNIYGPFLVVQE